MTSVAYTGVGSRRTPGTVQTQMRDLAHRLARGGLLLRSGADDGADAAFEAGAKYGDGAREIYLPWPGFNSHSSGIVRLALHAELLAKSVHPSWPRLSPAARRCHTCNVHQVLGVDVQTPSRFVVCWTPDGCTGKRSRTADTGATATVILIAELFGVPVVNMAHQDWQEIIERLVGTRAAALQARPDQLAVA